MSTLQENPFRVPHAANLRDTEIESFWVDIGEEGGFEQIFRPASLMPMIVLGGKGSGKTHLMRHFSFELQSMRASGDIKQLIRQEKYIGIYLRSSGLHASRFQREGHSQESWTSLFAYYVELWFMERLCAVVSDIFPLGNRDLIDAPEFLAKVINLFDRKPFETPKDWEGLVSNLDHVRRHFDLAVNNTFGGDAPKVDILCSRGALIFGFPQLLASSFPEIFAGIAFTWMVDEYEHFHHDAQRYINTLVREKEQPSTFKIGVRSYGIYTYKTFSNEEVLKKESEYEELHLDQRLRTSDSYGCFALNIVRRRLETAGWTGNDVILKGAFADEESLWDKSLNSWNIKNRRPWIEKLEKQLATFVAEGSDSSPFKDIDIKAVISSLSNVDNPYLEKLNTFLFYRAWSKKSTLSKAALDIAKEAAKFQQGEGGTEHEIASKKFKSDLMAQMRRSLQLPVIYTGFDTFVQMSSGVARSLLVILKKIYDEALYSGEQLFVGDPVSGNVQSRGVSGASDWFFEDILIYGEEGLKIRAAIERLGRLFRALRFCEKPPECSLNSFSFDPNSLSATSAKLMDLAVKWSVFIPGKDRLDRNTGMPNRLYRLSGMLCPKFELPLSSRGNIALNSDEIDALFDVGSSDSPTASEKRFGKIILDRTLRCIPPFITEMNSKTMEGVNYDEQPDLFGGL